MEDAQYPVVKTETIPAFLRAVTMRDPAPQNDPVQLPPTIRTGEVSKYNGARERSLAERMFRIQPGATLPANVHASFRQLLHSSPAPRSPMRVRLPLGTRAAKEVTEAIILTLQETGFRSQDCMHINTQQSQGSNCTSASRKSAVLVVYIPAN